MTTTTMQITEARRQFTQFPKMFGKKRPDVRAVEVESHGRPVMAVLSWDLYESLMETLEVMGDARLMKLLRSSLREAEQGKTMSWDAAKAKLKL
jgi:PHD/YefM family antitoxin component YafN of YafNO toxin-antitoxin module